MAVNYFPFNSIVVDGVADRAANAEDLAAYLAGFFSNGVIMQTDTALKVVTGSGMQLQIMAGAGCINGKAILNNAAESIMIEAASATLNRIDRVIFRLDEKNRLMEFDVLKGTAASNPTAPALTQGADIYELCLADVRVPAGATTITAAYITDRRADVSLCGYSRGIAKLQGIDDYIIETGIDGNWYYQKYKNGTFEAWSTNPIATGERKVTATGSLYYSALAPISVPSFVKRIDFVSAQSFFYNIVNFSFSTNNEDALLKIMVISTTNTTGSLDFRAYLKGNWE